MHLPPRHAVSCGAQAATTSRCRRTEAGASNRARAPTVTAPTRCAALPPMQCTRQISACRHADVHTDDRCGAYLSDLVRALARGWIVHLRPMLPVRQGPDGPPADELQRRLLGRAGKSIAPPFHSEAPWNPYHYPCRKPTPPVSSGPRCCRSGPSQPRPRRRHPPASAPSSRPRSVASCPSEVAPRHASTAPSASASGSCRSCRSCR